jgi:hypothetical protein
MTDDVGSEKGLDRIWNHGIMPLLVEHFYGQPGTHARFALADIRKSVAKDRRTEVSWEKVVGEVVICPIRERPGLNHPCTDADARARR